jgi:Xaa-Pro aminopeptidase
MIDTLSTIRAIREENLDGWLFSNVFHRDEVSDLVLGVPRDGMNTRPWVCVIFPDKPAFKIVHSIERGILDHVPGTCVVYSSRKEFLNAAGGALHKGMKVAAQYSSRFPVVSFLDHGTALLLEQAGAELVSSDGIIARVLGTLDDEGIASHERAGKVLYRIVSLVWRRISDEMRGGKTLTEGEVREWMSALLEESGLESDEPPLVAMGQSSADPHYTPRNGGRVLSPGNVVQLDIWAKERFPSSVYADISWVGVLSREPEPRFVRAFDAVRRARDTAVERIGAGLSMKEPPSGEDVDLAVRTELARLGYAAYLRHRTGHSIGARVHGFGVNLDSVEFPDGRRLREGACFSIEPGVYLPDFGMRTEIDAYIRDGRLTVSGGDPQGSLLALE